MKMKKLLLIALAAVAIACSKADDEATMVNCPEGTGIVSFGVAPALVIEGTRAQVQLPEGTTVPAGADFALAISSTDAGTGYQGGTWTSVASFNENYKKNYFVAGMYDAVVTSGDPAQEGENKPYFRGEVQYNVNARQLVNVTIPAKLANSIVKVEFTDTFKSYFENGAAITITSGNGSEWAVDYDTTPYIFVESGKKVTISGSAIKQKPSATVDAPTVVFDAVEKTLAACTMYTYKYDVSTAGNVSVTIEITNKPTETVEVGTEELNDDAVPNQPAGDDNGENGDDTPTNNPADEN